MLMLKSSKLIDLLAILKNGISNGLSGHSVKNNLK
jgi:hypothetical protein